MPVTDFECQIARGQIGRYLGGGLLSPQAMSGLEEHLAECPGCRALVAERRASLLGQLGSEVPTRAVVSMPVTEENPLVAAVRSRAESLKAAANQTSETAKPSAAEKTKAAPRYAKAAPAKTKPKTDPNDKPKSVMTKPLVLGGLLAVVLIGMSYLTHSNGGKGALGGKAAEVFAAAETSKPFAADALADKPTAPEVEPAAARPTPPAETTIEPKPVDKTAANPDSREAVAKTPAVANAATPLADQPKTDKPKVETPKAEVPKPPVKKAEPVLKPVVKAAVVKAPIQGTAKRAVRRPAVHKRIVARKPRRTKRKSNSTVRVYGLDGHPLKS